jgi:hypothetical protein
MTTRKRKRTTRPRTTRTQKEIARDWLGVQLLLVAVVIFVPLLFAMVR